jgi:hypothetical protein
MDEDGLWFGKTDALLSKCGHRFGEAIVVAVDADPQTALT